MNSTVPAAGGSADVRPWVGRVALVVVVVTLITLVIVPILVQHRVTALRHEIEASEPARTLVNRLQFNLVREMAALSDVLLGGDGAPVETYSAAFDQERTLFIELDTLATRLGPSVEMKLAEAQALAEQWHARAATIAQVRSRVEHPDSLELPREGALFEQVLRATAALDSVILQVTAANRTRIERTERLGLGITFWLSILALCGAGAAAALYNRVQRFSAEAERRRALAERALRDAVAAEEARTRLLRGVTHDVKNPIGAAKGYAELLALEVKAPLDPAQAPLIDGIERSLDSALGIISDLLDVARADSGGLTVNRVATNLAEVVRLAVEDNRAAIQAAGHEVEFEAADNDVSVHTDPARIRQVLGNLLSNAVKYTPAPGRITVRTHISQETDDNREWAIVEVEDSGPGIPPELTEAVFGEFTRLDDTGVQGHGLGLSIARRVARLLGGDLELAQRDTPGALFILRLPCRKQTDLKTEP